MKTLEELTSVESSWPVVKDLIDQAKNRVEVLIPDPDAADSELVKLQQSLKSLMGAITYETGGILVDGGWIRILGAGSPELTRTISDWNLGRSHDTLEETPGFLMVADDALGGIFALNGGELGDDVGFMYYLSPDNASWVKLDVIFHEFLGFCFMGAIEDFYENIRWDGWEKDVAKISGDQAFMIVPPVWAEGPSINEREKVVISMEESYEISLETNNMLADMEDEHDCCGEHDDDCCGGHHDHDKSCGCGE